MKNSIKLILLVIFNIVTSCEDVIDVNVPEATARLVIEASLDWKKGTTGNEQTIKLSTSTPFFDTTTNNIVTGASVKVTNNNTLEEYNFVDQNNGTYTIVNFVPVINNSYTLDVVYNGERYLANEKLMSVSSINEVTQSVEGGFDNELLDVTIFFDDPVNEENYYFIKFIEDGDLFPKLETLPDEFVNGNELDLFFEKDGVAGDDDDNIAFIPGDVVDITLYGISKRYFNYIELLIEQSDSNGDPFSPTPAKIKGNCINQTNTNNFAFGYFRLAEFDTVNYIFQ